MRVERPIRKGREARRGAGGKTRRHAATLALGCLSLLFPAVASAETPPPEYHVKAAFLLNFTKFVEWPPAAFESRDSPLTICILGEDPFGKVLDQLVQGEVVDGRKLAVERLQSAPKPKACQVLFVGKGEEAVSELLAGLGPGVLTVGEQERFLRDGGIIAFVLEGRRVRFDVNLAAASKQSLAISARLLTVARSVRK